MATEANTQSFWQTSGRVAGGNYKNCRRSRRVRYRGFLSKNSYLALYSYRRMTVLLPISCSTGWLHGQEVQWNHFPFDLLIQG